MRERESKRERERGRKKNREKKDCSQTGSSQFARSLPPTVPPCREWLITTFNRNKRREVQKRKKRKHLPRSDAEYQHVSPDAATLRSSPTPTHGTVKNHADENALVPPPAAALLFLKTKPRNSLHRPRNEIAAYFCLSGLCNKLGCSLGCLALLRAREKGSQAIADAF